MLNYREWSKSSLIMPVTVSATLVPSRWPSIVHGFACILTSLFSIALFGHGYFIVLLVSAYLFVLRFYSTEHYQNIQWQGNEIFLNKGSASQKCAWSGYGRQSFAFIKLELKSETGPKSLVIWKDQVSDASWRALNMAFLVWQPAILQRLKTAKALPAKTAP